MIQIDLALTLLKYQQEFHSSDSQVLTLKHAREFILSSSLSIRMFMKLKLKA